jgi:hypothetical protein
MKSIVLFLLLAGSPCAFGQTDTTVVAVGSWSEPISDHGYALRGRLVLAEEAPFNGARMAVVYLELQNLSHVLGTVLVDFGEKTLHCEVVDAAGKTAPQTPTLASIFIPPPFTMVLPCDSTLRFRVSVSGWSIPRGPGWAIQLNSGFWFLPPITSGDRFLSGEFVTPRLNPTDIEARRKDLERGHVWHGALMLPKLKLPTLSK